MPPPPFDEDACALVEEFKPKVVSFHFGLPEQRLLARVKASGALVVSSATTVAEARWLEDHGCDAIVAQGYEAGGHRAMFLDEETATQVGGLSLIPQVVDAVEIPVIAAGGIADGRGIALHVEQVVGDLESFAEERAVAVERVALLRRRLAQNRARKAAEAEQRAGLHRL